MKNPVMNLLLMLGFVGAIAFGATTPSWAACTCAPGIGWGYGYGYPAYGVGWGYGYGYPTGYAWGGPGYGSTLWGGTTAVGVTGGGEVKGRVGAAEVKQTRMARTSTKVRTGTAAAGRAQAGGPAAAGRAQTGGPAAAGRAQVGGTAAASNDEGHPALGMGGKYKPTR